MTEHGRQEDDEYWASATMANTQFPRWLVEGVAKAAFEDGLNKWDYADDWQKEIMFEDADRVLTELGFHDIGWGTWRSAGFREGSDNGNR